LTIRNLNNKGFTLVELLLSLAIISIILLPLTMTVTTGYKTFFKEEENIEIMQNGRFALDKMTDAIRSADPEDIDVQANRLIIGRTTYYRYGAQLMEEIGDTSNDIARYIESLTITKNNSNLGQLKSIDITIVLKGPRLKSYTLKTTVYIRNR